MGRDGDSLNTHFTSHKSPPAPRPPSHVTATSCNKQLKSHTDVWTWCGTCINTHEVCGGGERRGGGQGVVGVFGQCGDKKKERFKKKDIKRKAEMRWGLMIAVKIEQVLQLHQEKVKLWGGKSIKCCYKTNAEGANIKPHKSCIRKKAKQKPNRRKITLTEMG